MAFAGLFVRFQIVQLIGLAAGVGVEAVQNRSLMIRCQRSFIFALALYGKLCLTLTSSRGKRPRSIAGSSPARRHFSHALQHRRIVGFAVVVIDDIGQAVGHYTHAERRQDHIGILHPRETIRQPTG